MVLFFRNRLWHPSWSPWWLHHRKLQLHAGWSGPLQLQGRVSQGLRRYSFTMHGPGHVGVSEVTLPRWVSKSLSLLVIVSWGVFFVSLLMCLINPTGPICFWQVLIWFSSIFRVCILSVNNGPTFCSSAFIKFCFSISGSWLVFPEWKPK